MVPVFLTFSLSHFPLEIDMRDRLAAFDLQYVRFDEKNISNHLGVCRVVEWIL